MKKIGISITAFSLMVGGLSACGTPYQKVGFTGGYSDQKISNDTVIITVAGNAFTSEDTIETMGMRRAAEVTLQNGFDYFIIESGRNRTQNSTAQLSSPTANTRCNGFSNSINCKTTFSGANEISVTKHRTKIRIRMFKGIPPKRTGYYLANEVLKYTGNVSGKTIIDHSTASGSPNNVQILHKKEASIEPPKYTEPSGGQSYIYRLKELKKLNENGTISKEEYSKKRKDIINEIVRNPSVSADKPTLPLQSAEPIKGYCFLRTKYSHQPIADKCSVSYGKGDFAIALREWTPLAKQGNSGAQFNLGQLYRRGQGVQQNYKTAGKWYSLSAEQGNAHAQNNLGNRHKFGQGVPQDSKAAVKWWKLAAEQGGTFAQNNLGRAYAKGQGVIQDNVYAHMWFNIAASSGESKNASKNRDIVAKRMTPAQIAAAQKLARECVRKKYKGC